MTFSRNSIMLAFYLIAAIFVCQFVHSQEQHVVIDERNHHAETEVGSFSHRSLSSNTVGGKRHLIENGKRVLYTGVASKLGCNDPNGSPCGPESKCEQVNITSFICQNEFYYGCVAGCGPDSTCTRGSDMVYYCKCNDGYYRPQDWMPCRAIV